MYIHHGIMVLRGGGKTPRAEGEKIMKVSKNYRLSQKTLERLEYLVSQEGYGNKTELIECLILEEYIRLKRIEDMK